MTVMTTIEHFDVGVWYQSAISGLWYRTKGAAGEVSAIRTDGVEEIIEVEQ